MKLKGKNIIITGGASGIGHALAVRFRAEGAASITVGDLQADKLAEVAREVDGLAVPCDVSKEADIQNLVAQAEATHGPTDVFCSNAGLVHYGWEEAADEIWDTNWQVHVMAHVYAARAVVPGMLERARGYLVNTASAAGLLSQIDSASYAVTKHAAVAFAETLAIRYGDKGIHVSVLCPQSVRTPMTVSRGKAVSSIDGMLETATLADCVIKTMHKEEFLILPHPQVRDYLQRKTSDYDRWLSGMRRLRDRFLG
jgi:NAD(P)-dependent dehydrogenase (short-subunit alcohol dehydrogenase family)